MTLFALGFVLAKAAQPHPESILADHLRLNTLRSLSTRGNTPQTHTHRRMQQECLIPFVWTSGLCSRTWHDDYIICLCLLCWSYLLLIIAFTLRWFWVAIIGRRGQGAARAWRAKLRARGRCHNQRLRCLCLCQLQVPLLNDHSL